MAEGEGENMWESGSSGHPLCPTYCRFLGHGLGLSSQGKKKPLNCARQKSLILESNKKKKAIRFARDNIKEQIFFFFG